MFRLPTLLDPVAIVKRRLQVGVLTIARRYTTAVHPSATELRAKLSMKSTIEQKKKTLLQKQREREEKRRKKEMEMEKRRKEAARVRAYKDRLNKLKENAKEIERRRKERQRLAEAKKRAEMTIKKDLLKQKQKQHSTKRKKDPDAPKRPMRALFWYITQNFKKVQSTLKKEDRAATLVEVQKVLKEDFEKLPEEEKEYYEKLASEDAERYKAEMKLYRQKKEKNKRPIGPYLRFFQEIRSTLKTEQPDLKLPEYAKIAGQKWRELPDDEKQKYLDQYENEVEERKKGKNHEFE